MKYNIKGVPKFVLEKQTDLGQVYFIWNVILPLMAGGSIYLLFRPKSLLMFDIIRSLGIEGLVDKIRYFSLSIKEFINPPIIYSLPNALWMYSFYSSVSIIWIQEKFYWKFLIFFSTVIFFTLEILQLYSWINGTFSSQDLFLSLLSLFTFILFHPSILK